MGQSEKEQVKSLWKRCFNDSDEFIELYFSRRYNDDINIALYDESKVISALQMIPYTMTFLGKEIAASYISGAATDPDYRNRGAMAKLLGNTHKRMYDNGVALSFLIPADKWLIDYYSKFGYETIFFSDFIEQGSFSFSPEASTKIEFSDTIDERIYDYLSERMLSIPNAIQHSFEDLSIVMEDIKLANGNIAVAYNKGSICGVAFSVPYDGKVIIKAIISDSQKIKDTLLVKLMEYYNVDTTVYRIFSGPSLQPYGMARVINLENLLFVWADKNSSTTISINVSGDNVIPQNNGLYVICNGKCYHYENSNEAYTNNSAEVKKALEVVEECNINMVINLLFTELNPYISLMMD